MQPTMPVTHTRQQPTKRMTQKKRQKRQRQQPTKHVNQSKRTKILSPLSRKTGKRPWRIIMKFYAISLVLLAILVTVALFASPFAVASSLSQPPTETLRGWSNHEYCPNAGPMPGGCMHGASCQCINSGGIQFCTWTCN